MRILYGSIRKIKLTNMIAGIIVIPLFAKIAVRHSFAVLKDRSERNEAVATAPSQGVAKNLAHDEAVATAPSQGGVICC